MVKTEELHVPTRGNNHVLDITAEVARAVARSGVRDGTVTVFHVHEQTWHDDNGHSHVRASLLGPSLSVPFVEGHLMLGTWQQIILVDFDTHARKRNVICQIIGE